MDLRAVGYTEREWRKQTQKHDANVWQIHCSSVIQTLEITMKSKWTMLFLLLNAFDQCTLFQY